MKSQDTPVRKMRLNIRSIAAIYIGIILIITVLTWLAYEDIITVLTHSFSVHFSARDIVQVIAAIFCVSTALIYLKKYRELRNDIYYWYSLGLILFAAGVIFISRGPLEGRIAWLGRAAEYAGSLYFLIAASGIYKQSRNNGEANSKDF
jgi:phosphoglycerol transferase MdoB-like AlkP superfamily enzyme